MPPPLAPYGMCLKIMNERDTKGGMGSTAKPLKFLDQEYNTLQDYCLKNNLRFVDEFFPPDLRSIGKVRLERDEMAKIEWKRPMIISKNARFVVDGVSRFDYAQGTVVGNCWFLASVGALTFQKKMFPHIIPPGQSLCNNYAGIFHFRFWRFGRWYDVVIDDKLPTLHGKLIFVQSKTRNEFWPALLEKAYAKVCGSYADMHAGRVSEALLDFSGGVHMHFDLKSAPADLWKMMYRASQAHALMGCETAGGGRESLLPNGIVMGHAYTVTGAYQATIGGHPVQLVRLFNPWGNTEWTGDWSDYSPLWNRVSERDRKEHLAAENGEFWMSMKDFTTFFDNMDICSRCPDFLEDTPKCQWTFKYHYGRWVTGSTAGGGMNYQETFCRNPQFWLRVNEMSKGCEDGHNNVLVSLIQIPDKRNRRSVSVHTIAFSVFAVSNRTSLMQCMKISALYKMCSEFLRCGYFL
ncbi:calpain-1 catalytic subunit [Triplophysa rosa]|uniref:calpain-1 catalytic subunit n=1 Tax=Triplophysa rosa TaxID=992332 RepID=UPI002545F643|nr:calpain-1 catalytic subunit [Triplophysa rosa]XP_057199029.1 calpain-1 catalytic subunit [Triplophysa rosa]